MIGNELEQKYIKLKNELIEVLRVGTFLCIRRMDSKHLIEQTLLWCML